MSQTKEVLLEKSSLLRKHDSEILSKKFRERVVKNITSKIKTLEAFRHQSKKTSQLFQKSPINKREIVKRSKLYFQGVTRASKGGTTQVMEKSNNKGGLLVS